MERNRWETAIRCLEVAVHPNTSDDEVVAAVNGFRRTADGKSLSEVCVEFAGARDDGGAPLAELAELQEKLERLNRENRELRRKLAVDEAAQTGTAHRLDAAFRRVHELNEEMLAAQRRADAAEREFADFRAAYARIVAGVNHDKFDLRGALEEARLAAVQRPVPAAAASFASVLTEARFGADPGTPFASGSGRLPPGDPRRPWTA